MRPLNTANSGRVGCIGTSTKVNDELSPFQGCADLAREPRGLRRPPPLAHHASPSGALERAAPGRRLPLAIRRGDRVVAWIEIHARTSMVLCRKQPQQLADVAELLEAPAEVEDFSRASGIEPAGGQALEFGFDL